MATLKPFKAAPPITVLMSMYKLPSSLKLRLISNASNGGGLLWDVVSKRGTTVMAHGKAPNAKQAKVDAWHALEEMGLVTDE